MEQDIFQRLLALLDDLSEEQREQLKQLLDGERDFERIASMIDSRIAEDRKCAHCGSTNVGAWGKRRGIQRYRCRDCKRTFNALTNSPLAHLHKIDRWLNMAMAIKETWSVRKTATHCGIAVSTAFRWRHRFLKAATEEKPGKLEDIAEADETYFRESLKGCRQLDRPARKRGGKASKRGLSAEQVPVLIARDRYGAVIDAVLPDQTKISVKKALGGRLGADNILCIDGGNALWGFASDEKIPVKVILAGDYVHKGDPIFHIQNVNGYHHRLKAWMVRFCGVATKYLSNYLGWRRVIEKPGAILTPTAWLQTALG